MRRRRLRAVSIRLSDDEAWAVIEKSHTGIVTTLRADGSPIALPIWFVALDRTIYLRTPQKAKKVARVRRDPRASFLVESGDRWADLCAVHLGGRLELVDDETTMGAIQRALDDKYAAFRTDRSAMPDATREHYAQWCFLRFVPEGRALTWDNSCIALKQG